MSIAPSFSMNMDPLEGFEATFHCAVGVAHVLLCQHCNCLAIKETFQHSLRRHCWVIQNLESQDSRKVIYEKVQR